jgi:hypothetical protein
VEVEAGGSQVQGHPGLYSETLSQKKKKKSRAGDVAQLVCEKPWVDPQHQKKKKRKEKSVGAE